MRAAEFFRTAGAPLVDSPNGCRWWHTMPLPDGTRIRGANADKDLQLKMWQALGIESLAGQTVLDVGANDGFFTLAALVAGASAVTAVNSADWDSWPRNIEHACRAWGAAPEIVTADFRGYPFAGTYDVIFLFGVLYHVEDVFGCVRTLARLLAPGGALFIESQMTAIPSELPIFECASDIYPTIAPQGHAGLAKVGIANYLFPNEPAIRTLAWSYHLSVEGLAGGRYTLENPTRRFFRLRKDPTR